MIVLHKAPKQVGVQTNVNKINREPVLVSKPWHSVQLLHFQLSSGMTALEPADVISPLWCKALDVPRRETFLYVCMREFAEFVLDADWEKRNFGHLEACPNVHPMYPFLQGGLACPFSFMVKFGMGVLHIFLNDMVQEDLLLAFMDEHRVHLPVHHQQTQPHSVCVPVCPNSMWLRQHSTKPKLIYLVTGRAFPFRLGMMLTTRL